MGTIPAVSPGTKETEGLRVPFRVSPCLPGINHKNTWKTRNIEIREGCSSWVAVVRIWRTTAKMRTWT